MRNAMLVAVMAILVAGAFGCASQRDMYAKPTPLGNGMVAVQGGDVGVFGTDNSWGGVAIPGTPGQVYRLEYSHNRSVTKWKGCPDAIPNRNARDIVREEERESGFDDKVIGGSAPTFVSTASAGNPSTGNTFVGNIPVAAGVATTGFGYAPAKTIISQKNQQTGGGATVKDSGNSQALGLGMGGQGGAGGQGGTGGSATGGTIGNVTATGTGTASSSSSSSSSSSAAAAAGSGAGTN